ncbi:MAG: hypothetical protein H6767_03405 [Candidatus Peribacteria bacterium]|nr:MAG: hypothetical protein H6767_03405 [Candidatus Peribacteria bacterium]
MLASFRQGFFVALYGIGVVFFYIIGAPMLVSGFLLAILVLFLEGFIQNISYRD